MWRQRCHCRHICERKKSNGQNFNHKEALGLKRLLFHSISNFFIHIFRVIFCNFWHQIIKIMKLLKLCLSPHLKSLSPHVATGLDNAALECHYYLNSPLFSFVNSSVRFHKLFLPLAQVKTYSQCPTIIKRSLAFFHEKNDFEIFYL